MRERPPLPKRPARNLAIEAAIQMWRDSPRVTPDGETTIIEMVQRDGRASEGIVDEEFRTPEALGLEPLSDTAYLEHLFDSAVEYYGM